MTDLEQLDALIDKQEASIAAAFRFFVNAVGRDTEDNPIYAAIIERLEARDQEGAMAIVDSYITRMADVLPVVAQTVGAATAVELAAIVPNVVLAVSFDVSNPRAAEAVRTNRLEFIREFSTQQRRSTQQALGRAMREGLGTAETARAFRNSIGLTTQQEAAVANYSRLLREGNSQALDRALRDRRFDRTVENAIEQGRPLTENQIRQMTDRYRARYLAMRSETIARTEGGRAISQAREESVVQMMEQTGVTEEQIDQFWQPTGDKRTRQWHASMAGQKRRRGELFVDGHGNRLRYPHDPKAPAETTINCRCVLTFSIRTSA